MSYRVEVSDVDRRLGTPFLLRSGEILFSHFPCKVSNAARQANPLAEIGRRRISCRLSTPSRSPVEYGIQCWKPPRWDRPGESPRPGCPRLPCESTVERAATRRDQAA